MSVPRVAVVIAGLGRVPEELLRASETVLGPLEDVLALGFEQVPAPEVARRLAEATEGADRGAGVLIIADLCGSTVANQSYALARERARYDVLCGANLAMLMKLYTVDRRVLDPTALAQALAETARRGISIASDQIPGETSRDA
ncbi:MAG: hypothetical protein ABI333_27325 [bacterium]